MPRPDVPPAGPAARPADQTPVALLRRVEDLRVLVVGDAVLDVWMYGASERLSREAPTPVVDVDGWQHAAGGAANCAANAATLGARVSYLGIVGNDPTGRRLRSALLDLGVDVARVVTDRDRHTVTKRRLVADDHVLARFDTGAGGTWSRWATDRLTEEFLDAAPHADVVLVADYGAGCLGDDFRRAVATVRERIHGPLVVDGHGFEGWAGCRPTALAPSAAEVAALMGWDDGPDRVEVLSSRSAQALDRCGADLLLTTMDQDGTLLHQAGRHPHRTRASRAPKQNTCGAGDTFTTAFALALGVGARPERAADLAQCAADVVVREVGTSTCSARRLLERCSGGSRGVVADQEELAALVAERRADGARIVFTNGCFDVLHAGHAQYLQQARELGEVLVVAVNSDASVRRLKGPDRPVVPGNERAALVAALGSVDLVTLFEEDSPWALIERLRPDVYVKGGDYAPEMLPEAEVVERVGGEVVLVDYLAEHSTTDLVTRIQQSPVRPGRVSEVR